MEESPNTVLPIVGLEAPGPWRALGGAFWVVDGFGGHTCIFL